jgi:putative spermidine/putrescine transport system permease protein
MTSTAATLSASPPPMQRMRVSPAFSLGAPATLFVLFGLIAPLALMLRYSFNKYDPAELMISAITLENYTKFIGDAFYQQVLLATVGISALSTALCLIAGFPVAYYLVRMASPRMRSLLFILIILPLLMGNAVRTAAWMVILGDQGLLSSAVTMLGLSPVKLIYTPTAVVIGLVSVLLPFMIVTLQSVLEGIERNLDDAAASLGAGHLTVLRRIVLPLSLPGILAGTMLCFILSMNAYATPVLLGGPQFHMMAPGVGKTRREALRRTDREVR